MLTRRSVMLSGAVAGAAPLFPSFSHLSLFAETTSPKASTAKSAAPVVFSPALASYVASSGSVITKKLNQEGPSVRALKGAASLLRIAADHAHQNSLDALVQVLLNHQPDLSNGTRIHAATTQAIEGYRAFDPGAKMPDASFALNLTAEQSATMHAYVAKVGMTGVLRDMADLVSTTAH
ncbi:MAG: hypothetical protein INR62_13435, partial [Rhodospirillales bacterium]|nr:hypothetical protein [Acetobacter sp.]